PSPLPPPASGRGFQRRPSPTPPTAWEGALKEEDPPPAPSRAREGVLGGTLRVPLESRMHRTRPARAFPLVAPLLLLAGSSVAAAQDAVPDPTPPEPVITGSSEALWEPGRWTLQLEP